MVKKYNVPLLDEAMVIICQESEKDEERENEAFFPLIINPFKEEGKFEKVVTMVYNKKHETGFEMGKQVEHENKETKFEEKMAICLKNGIEDARKLFMISKRNITFQQIRQPM